MGESKMSESELNETPLDEFSELSEEFEEYTSWQDGMDTGCFVTYEDLILPRTRRAFRERDDHFLDTACRLVERLLTMGDPYADNDTIFGILEGVKSTEGQSVVRPYLGPRSLEVFDYPSL